MSGSAKRPVAEAALLIRRPVAEVFEAFVDPAITTRFWFSKSSGRLEPGARITWSWEMYGASGEIVGAPAARGVERLKREAK